MATEEEQAEEPEAKTLDLIYGEVDAQLSKQFEQIAALNGRAQQLLGFAAGTFALIVGLRPPSRDAVIAVLFAVAALIFIGIVAVGYRAWSIHGWRRDPQPEQLWRRYRLSPEGWLRQQIILNWLESWRENRATIDAKLFYLRATQVLLGIEVSYLVIVLILRPYVE